MASRTCLIAGENGACFIRSLFFLFCYFIVVEIYRFVYFHNDNACGGVVKIMFANLFIGRIMLYFENITI